MLNPKEIGNRIRDLREEAGQSKRFLARAIGVSYTSVCSYEYGDRVPSDDVKIKLARHFKRSVGEIFFSEDNHETRTDNQKRG